MKLTHTHTLDHNPQSTFLYTEKKNRIVDHILGPDIQRLNAHFKLPMLSLKAIVFSRISGRR